MVRNNNEVSFHFAVDDHEVVQGLPLDRNAWQTGDGSAQDTGNRTSIGIEVCYSKSGGERYRKAEALAIKFIAQLLHERGWGVDRVKTHHDWTVAGVRKGYSRYVKNCPHRVLDEGRWDDVKAAIARELAELNGGKYEEPKHEKKHQYDPKQSPAGGETSIVDYLKKMGQDSGFSYRKDLARRYGIKNYRGTAAQNTKLLNKLRNRTQKKESEPKTEAKQIPSVSKETSIVDYLNKTGQDSSFKHREELARKYGIMNYRGTASQNTELLSKLKKGSSPKHRAESKINQKNKYSSSIVPYPGHLIRVGSRGKDVQRIQRAVGATPDGVYGPATKRAVQSYQSRHGLAADGIVGPATWAVMF
jgi:N-acetylmuramoyl-L-alanine amidase CwlA